MPSAYPLTMMSYLPQAIGDCNLQPVTNCLVLATLALPLDYDCQMGPSPFLPPFCSPPRISIHMCTCKPYSSTSLSHNTLHLLTTST